MQTYLRCECETAIDGPCRLDSPLALVMKVCKLGVTLSPLGRFECSIKASASIIIQRPWSATNEISHTARDSVADIVAAAKFKVDFFQEQEAEDAACHETYDDHKIWQQVWKSFPDGPGPKE